jgi:hypothetical protein
MASFSKVPQRIVIRIVKTSLSQVMVDGAEAMEHG